MSFNLQKCGDVICKIVDNPRYKNKKVSLCKDKLDDEKDDIKQYEEMKLTTGMFQLIPDKNKDRVTMYVTGSAGSGKSYFVAKYCIEYHNTFPDNEIYLISENDEDKVFDDLAYIKRVIIDDLHTDPLDWKEFKDCLIVFDDIDSIKNKLGKTINELRDKVLKNSRKFHVSVISTAHNSTGLDLKSVLNESQIIVFFLSNYSRGLKYLLENYIGMSRKGVDKLRKLTDSRWTAIIKNYPNVLLQEKYITTMNKFDNF
jgi:nucleoside-triphosphatase THEP1